MGCVSRDTFSYMLSRQYLCSAWRLRDILGDGDGHLSIFNTGHITDKKNTGDLTDKKKVSILIWCPSPRDTCQA